MVHQKKVHFFQRLTSKMVNIQKQPSDKCRASSPKPTRDQSNRGIGNNQDKRAQDFPLFDLRQNQNDFKQETKHSLKVHQVGLSTPGDFSNGANRAMPNSLLAAKLNCNEWGLLCSKPVVTKVLTVSQIPGFSKPSEATISQPSRTVQIRIEKSQHPSYKSSTGQRYRSMKERREAKEKQRKFRSFHSSLSKIDEIDERGIE